MPRNDEVQRLSIGIKRSGARERIVTRPLAPARSVAIGGAICAPYIRARGLFKQCSASSQARSPDDIGGLQAAVLKNADASHRRWRNPGIRISDSAPDFASLHPGYGRCTHCRPWEKII